MYLNRISGLIGSLILNSFFVVAASAFEIDTLSSDTLKADTTQTDTAFYSSIKKDTTFETDGRTKILTHDKKKFLYYDLSLTKKHDRIKQIYLGKHLIYDRNEIPDTDFVENEWNKICWKYSFIKHGIFTEKKKVKVEEKIAGEYRQIKKFIYWNEDKIKIHGKLLLDTLIYSGDYHVVYDTGKGYKDSIEFDLDDKSLRMFGEFSMGITYGSDKIYRTEPDGYYGGYGLDYYALGYGFRAKDFLTAIRLSYNGFDDKFTQDTIKYRNHHYRWEVYTLMSQRMWLSFDTNIELEEGYKAGKLRAFYRKYNTETKDYKQYYNFSIKDHGLSLGGSLNYRNLGLKYEYSWLFGGYHTISFRDFFLWNSGGGIGTVYRYTTGKNLREFLVTFEATGQEGLFMSKLSDNFFIGLIGVAGGTFALVNLFDSLSRIFAGQHYRD